MVAQVQLQVAGRGGTRWPTAVDRWGLGNSDDVQRNSYPCATRQPRTIQ